MKRPIAWILASLLVAAFTGYWANTLPDLREELAINDSYSLYHEYYAPRGASFGPDPNPGRSLVYLVNSGSKDRELIPGACWQDFTAASGSNRLLLSGNSVFLQSPNCVYWRSHRTRSQWLEWRLHSELDLYSFIRSKCLPGTAFREQSGERSKKLLGPSDIFVTDSPGDGCWLPYEVESINLGAQTLRMKRVDTIEDLPACLIYRLVPDDLFGEKWVFDRKDSEACQHQ